MDKKNVVITGGARGIGLECVKLFLDNQYNVFVLDIIDSKVMNDIFCDNNLHYYRCDVSNSKEVSKIRNIISKETNGIDILINCAAIQIEESFSEYNQKNWQKVINTNYFGTCNCIHSFVKNMTSGSTILNMISIHSSKPRIYKYAYDSSKSAVEMLTKELGLELADRGITVNALSFGAVDTQMNSIWKEQVIKKEEARSKVPLGIIFNPEQIATFALNIIKYFATYTTGSVFVIDGGRSLT